MTKRRRALPPKPTVSPRLVSTTTGAHGRIVRMVFRRHMFKPGYGQANAPLVCPSCRTPGGNRPAWPCDEFVEVAELLGVKLDPTPFRRIGVTLPAALDLYAAR